MRAQIATIISALALPAVAAAATVGPCPPEPPSLADAVAGRDVCAPRPPAPVGCKVTTAKGLVFERVAVPGFADAWRAPDGTIWTERIGLADNAGANHITIVTGSAAVRLCAERGARLPSRADYEALKRSFVYDAPNVFTDMIEWCPPEGRAPISNYWSSTDYLFHQRDGYLFRGADGMIVRTDRATVAAVRCVIPAGKP